MNEFQAKKLGEVLAFAKVGVDTMEKARNSFVEIFGSEAIGTFTAKNQEHIDAIHVIATREQVADIVNTKAEGTGTKLMKMREVYIGDQWEKPSEIAEWLGFFEGAAYVHWNLVDGAGEALHVDGLKILADDAVASHKSLLEQASNYLKELGKTKK
jgi:hypothetical protein